MTAPFAVASVAEIQWAGRWADTTLNLSLKDHGRPTHLGRSRLKYLLCFPDKSFFLVMCVLVPPKHFGTLIYYISYSQNLCPSRKKTTTTKMGNESSRFSSSTVKLLGAPALACNDAAKRVWYLSSSARLSSLTAPSFLGRRFGAPGEIDGSSKLWVAQTLGQ